ncbi:hypothetical protein [Erythrobacter litoralis]|uniref:EF-hand domain-containing protein n=1 Tax=Erythrobacter litoralis (strain HTCC2594) TaxID=314225 RepID=Q2N9Y8_ERYLH|nr:hypothetical protein [Erythrobacter litoralis]ABC63503.1 hypothetical protein ELI_07055 [Erythrobacter litoralis HTCC2594]
MRKIIAFAATVSLASLAACDSDDVENTVVDDIDEIADADTEYDPMTRDYTLSEDAQARRDAFDADAFGTEYAGYRDEVVAERDTEESMAAEREAERMAASSDNSGSGSDDASSGSSSANAGSSADSSGSNAMPTRDSTTNMRTRASMTWSYLDRNDDNRLSVAEYAIWAIPLDPTNPKPNDEVPPYVTPTQANKAADSFFYYDVDGDTYLDRREFTAARRGENFDPAATP